MSNLPQTLEERTRFVLDALLATGITASWMSAFAASPDRFRDFLRAHRKMASLHIHPDILEGGGPETRALSELASPYLTAIDSLLLLGDEELPNALQRFADRYGTGRSELLDKLQELLSERRLIQEKALRDAEQVQRDRSAMAAETQAISRQWSGFYNGHFTGYAPYVLPGEGTTIRVTDLRQQFLATPLTEDTYTAKPGHHLGYVDAAGDLYTGWVDGTVESKSLPQAARTLLLGKNGKPLAKHHRGRIIALSNTEILDTEEVDSLLSARVHSGEILHTGIPIQKLIAALSGKIRQDEKWNRRSRSTESAGWSVRHAVLVAIQPETEPPTRRHDAAFATDTLTLTLFPLATLLPESGTIGD